jgi:hypothetical protein
VRREKLRARKNGGAEEGRTGLLVAEARAHFRVPAAAAAAGGVDVTANDAAQARGVVLART